MKSMKSAKSVLASLLIAAGTAAAPAAADLSVSIGIGIPLPPPAPIVEVIPASIGGYVWVPGYWAWHHDRHIWVHGRQILARPGYHWAPERWEPRGGRWHFVAGGWAHDKHWKKHNRGRAYGHLRVRD